MDHRPIDRRSEQGSSDAATLPVIGDGDCHLETGLAGFEADVADDDVPTLLAIDRLGDESLAVFVVGPAEEVDRPCTDAVADGVESGVAALRREPRVEAGQLGPVV